jgi:biopolymer transport protein ExbB
VIVHKLLQFRRLRADPTELMARIRSLLLRGDARGALDACAEHAGPVAAVLRAGLSKVGEPAARAEKTMESVALHEVAYLDRHVSVLAAITTLAPLLGFLGTVVGMIQAFAAVEAVGLNAPVTVAHGIRVALSTTAWGLAVAFFTYPFHVYFTRKVAGFAREIETAANVLCETLEETERVLGDGVRAV